MKARYKGIIFDMDGTLTLPSLDFEELRLEIGFERGEDVLKKLEAMPDALRRKGLEAIARHEAKVRARTEVRPGAKAMLERFRDAGAKLGIITRNTAESVDDFLWKIGFAFDEIVTREFPSVKPSPEPALHILRKWGLPPQDALMVGDYKFDIECGRAAGSATCFLQNEGQESFAHLADYSVSSFEELESLVLR